MTLPGAAGEAARMLPGSACHDIYDADGASLYHRLTADDPTEVAELLRLLRGVRGPVLELACGSGRLTLPMLAAGHEVTAMDLSPAMIALLDQALARSPKLRRRADRLSTVVADMSDFALPARFGAVVLGTTSITLLPAAGRAACFACVRRHLAGGGRFVVSTLDLTGGERETVSTLPGGTLHEYVDPAAGRRWTSVVLTGDDGAPRKVFSSSPRLVSSDALSAELARARLEVVGRHPVALGAGSEGRSHWLLECAA